MKLIKRFKQCLGWYFLDKNLIPAELHTLNTEKFTAEQIAKIMHWSVRVSRWVCNTAVRRNEFIKIDETHYKLNESTVNKR